MVRKDYLCHLELVLATLDARTRQLRSEFWTQDARRRGRVPQLGLDYWRARTILSLLLGTKHRIQMHVVMGAHGLLLLQRAQLFRLLLPLSHLAKLHHLLPGAPGQRYRHALMLLLVLLDDLLLALREGVVVLLRGVELVVALAQTAVR